MLKLSFTTQIEHYDDNETIVDYFFLIVTEFQRFKNLTIRLVTSVYYL